MYTVYTTITGNGYDDQLSICNYDSKETEAERTRGTETGKKQEGTIVVDTEIPTVLLSLLLPAINITTTLTITLYYIRKAITTLYF